jgi:hypothetical protein
MTVVPHTPSSSAALTSAVRNSGMSTPRWSPKASERCCAARVL